MRELTLPLLMDGGQAPVVSTLVFRLQSNGNHDVAAAVAIYMILILLVLVVLARHLPGADIGKFARRRQRRYPGTPVRDGRLGMIDRTATPIQ